MSYVKPGFKLCVCDGRYDGCEHRYPCGIAVFDDSWGPWCSACNPRRMAALDADFARLRPVLTPPDGDPKP